MKFVHIQLCACPEQCPEGPANPPEASSLRRVERRGAQVLNELGGLAEGRGSGATEQRTVDAKAALRWIRDMRGAREQGLAPPLKFLVFQTRAEYEQVRRPSRAPDVPDARRMRAGVAAL